MGPTQSQATRRLCTLAVAALVLPVACGGDAGVLPPQAGLKASSLRKAAPPLPTCPTPRYRLREIVDVQGSGARSPFENESVSVRGIVTGDFRAGLGGFFIQQPAVAGSARGSSGIFVYAPGRGPALQPGDYVQVSGWVHEMGDAADATHSGSLTEIGSTSRIDLCGASTPIEPAPITIPFADDAEAERFEGMLVRIAQPLAVTDTQGLARQGEVVLAPQERLWQRDSDPVRDRDEAARRSLQARLVLDDGQTATFPRPTPFLGPAGTDRTRRVGDTVTGLEGVLSYGFGSFRLEPTRETSFAASNPRHAVPDAVGGNLRVAAFNLDNAFITLGSRGAASAAEQERQQRKLVAAIVALDADVLGLAEVENIGDDALAALVAAVNAAVGSEAYAWRTGAVTGNDAIRVAIVYKPARVVPVGALRSPLDPPVPQVLHGPRPSMAQRFASRDGGGFWFVMNHLKSKAACPDAPDSPDRDLGQGCSNASRVLHMQAIEQWVAGLVRESGEPDVLLMGDFNAYLREDPVRELEGNGWLDLIRRLPPRDRYTYVFGGESGALDHAFASRSMDAQITGVAIWHIDADEPATLDYRLSGKADDRYTPTPWRASDHDPVLVGLALTPGP